MSRSNSRVNWKKGAKFTISICILVSVIGFLLVIFAVSSGIIDLSKDPVTEAGQNTSGVPNITSSEHPSIDGYSLEMRIFERVNELREAHGRDPFVHSERVRLISRMHSADMAKRGFFDHTNPDGLSPPDRHEKYNGCENPNENIVEWESFTTADTDKIAREVVSTWSNSPGHNSSMLTPYDKVSGVGIHVTEQKELYVTQNFCREHPNA